MKDLDFDELDRAVNTLMGSVPKTETAGADPSIKTVSIAPTLPPEPATPSTSTPVTPSEPAAAPAPASAPTPAPSVAARRGGRFMDVVHSSSDMKKDKPTSPISRQGVTIEPTKPVTPEAPKPAAIPEPPKESVAPPVSAEPITPPADTASHSDWPDPLEMSGFGKTEEKKPEAEPTPLLEESSETPVTAPASEDLQPLSSPFLTDAKVEKRPLGGNISKEDEALEPDHTPVVADANTNGTVNDPNDQLPPSVEETKKELPPEFQGDLVAIESGSAEPVAPAPVEAPEEKKPGPEAPKEEKKSDAHPTALLEAKAEDDHEYSGPTSIAQQYKEEPNSGDQHNGAIYDTEAYHKPLAHPAKKKSGWLVVIWILVILVVGAGAGAALYFLGIF